MKSDILIISDDFIESPSEIMAFRTVTMIAHDSLGMEILFHTTQEMKDLNYHWMKRFGALDYVSYILSDLEWEEGIRIDTVKVYPDTIVIKAIRLENQVSLIGRIKSFSGK